MLKSSSIFFLLFSVSFPVFAVADWIDDAVIAVEQGVMETDPPDNSQYNPLDPFFLLPLSVTNQWTYDFQNVFEEPPQLQTLSAVVGEVEDLGDFCLSPLVFGDNQLKLYLGNHNDWLVFYGFSAEIAGTNTGFFFQNAAFTTVDSGIVLASSDAEHDLLLEQSSTQPWVINGQEIELTWIARKKTIEWFHNTQNYNGQVAGGAVTETPSEVYQYRFEFWLQPCAKEAGCYVSSFQFEFLPGIGLSRFELLGDNEAFGGQYHHIYTLKTPPDIAFGLEKQENQLAFFSCGQLTTGGLRASDTGTIGFWLIIMLLIDVVLGVWRHADRNRVT